MPVKTLVAVVVAVVEGGGAESPFVRGDDREGRATSSFNPRSMCNRTSAKFRLESHEEDVVDEDEADVVDLWNVDAEGDALVVVFIPSRLAPLREAALLLSVESSSSSLSFPLSPSIKFVIILSREADDKEDED